MVRASMDAKTAVEPQLRPGRGQWVLAIVILLGLLCGAGCSPAPDVPVESASVDGIPIYTYEVVRSFPHDPRAFTQGLQFYNGNLYESTGLYGRSSLRLVELETGRVLRRVNLPSRYFGEGIAVVGDRIFMLTYREETGFVFDRHTFERIGEFSYTGEGWGLAFDGTHLIMSDGTSTLRYLDLETQEVVRTQEIRAGDQLVREINELAMVNGELWANIFTTKFIARIDLERGEVVGWIDCTGLLPRDQLTGRVDVFNGIAYDPEQDRIFLTGKLWPWLFEIRVIPAVAARRHSHYFHHGSLGELALPFVSLFSLRKGGRARRPAEPRD